MTANSKRGWFTTTEPLPDGWYFWRKEPTGETEIARVYARSELITWMGKWGRVKHLGREEEAGDGEGITRLSDIELFEGEWWGPIAPEE